MELLAGGYGIQWIRLALANEKLGDHAKAIESYQKSVDCMDQHHCRHPLLVMFRKEAEALLAIDPAKRML